MGSTITSDDRRRILVTGATGLVGGRLAARLSETGASVAALSRDAVRAREQVRVLDDAYDWHGPRDEAPVEAFAGRDAVVHLAGESVSGRWTGPKKARIEASRVAGTERIIEALERADPRPRVLVSASAVGYYGDRGEEELSEDAPSGDDFLAGVCVGWERVARRAESLGVRVVCLRFGLVLAKEGGALEAMRPLFSAGLGGRIGDGRQWWSWIHAADAVSLIERAIEDEALSGPVNAVAPAPVRQADFAKTLAAVLHRPAFLPAPAFAVRATLGGFATELLASRRVVPTRALAAGFRHAHPELEGALRDLL